MDKMCLRNVGKPWLKGHAEFSLRWLYPVVRRLYRYSLSLAWKTIKYLESGCSSSSQKADLKSSLKTPLPH